jgi:hypothetical protein
MIGTRNDQGNTSETSSVAKEDLEIFNDNSTLKEVGN